MVEGSTGGDGKADEHSPECPLPNGKDSLEDGNYVEFAGRRMKVLPLAMLDKMYPDRSSLIRKEPKVLQHEAGRLLLPHDVFEVAQAVRRAGEVEG